jgi:hypothetical protein
MVTGANIAIFAALSQAPNRFVGNFFKIHLRQQTNNFCASMALFMLGFFAG